MLTITLYFISITLSIFRIAFVTNKLKVKILRINLQEIEVKEIIFKKRRIFKIFVEIILLDENEFG